MKNRLLTIFALIFTIQTYAQSSIDSVLEQISRNNKTIQASMQLMEAEMLEHRTRLRPENPSLEYDYLEGSPANKGVQHEFTAAQTFEFPTSYIKKSQLSKERSALSEIEAKTSRQDILLEAKKLCLELVFRNKLQKQLTEQKENTEKVLRDFQKKLDKGEGNILDLNKARLQLIEVRKQYQENYSAINMGQQRLESFNGGNKILFNDTVYPLHSAVPTFDVLESEYEKNDPVRMMLEQERVVAQKQLELNKALWLPKLKAGYRYQGIERADFHGIHTGVTIPLWENNKTIKMQKAKIVYADLEIEDHRIEHFYEISQWYENYLNLKLTLDDYQNVFASLNSTTLLNKALNLGEISTIEYFMEMNYYYNSSLSFLEVEKEMYMVLADLYKYKL
ncbi:MAG TPA: TolC family protein [Bacteroidia bacterium]|nr:TolC family protein [Bacteroidia bacterium]